MNTYHQHLRWPHSLKSAVGYIWFLKTVVSPKWLYFSSTPAMVSQFKPNSGWNQFVLRKPMIFKWSSACHQIEKLRCTQFTRSLYSLSKALYDNIIQTNLEESTPSIWSPSVLRRGPLTLFFCSWHLESSQIWTRGTTNGENKLSRKIPKLSHDVIKA